MQSQLTYISDSLAGFSANEVRVEASGSRNLGPSQTTSFTLPQNAIVRLSSFSVHAKVTATNARLPGANSLLERVEVSVGGQVISGSSSMWGTASAIKEALTGHRGDFVTQHGIMVPASGFSNGTPTAYADGYQIDHVSAGDPTSSDEVCQLTWSNWTHGFLSASPDYIDTSKMGPIVVRLTFASNAVIVGAGTSSYSIADITSTMEVASISNPMYEEMMGAIMAKAGYLPICFKEMHIIRAAHKDITRASVSSRSVDRVLVAFRNKNTTRDYDTQAVGIAVPDVFVGQLEDVYAPCETFGYGAALNGTAGASTDWGTNFIDIEGSINLGGTKFPQYRATFGTEWPRISSNALYKEEKDNLPEPLVGKNQGLFKQVLAAKINMAGTGSPVLSSGSNSKGQSLIIEAETRGIDQGKVICFICTECSSLLMLGPSRDVAIAR